MLVTGASRGIGAATAQALARAGAHVVLTARTAKDLEAVEESIHRASGSATIAPLDLADGDSIGRLAGAIAERWGKLDALVLNAAMLGTLACECHRCKGVFKTPHIECRRPTGTDCRFRSAPARRSARKTHCNHVERRRGATRLLGCLWRIESGARHFGRRLWRGAAQSRQGHCRHDRSRRHPHQDARKGLSGRRPRNRQTARSRGGTGSRRCWQTALQPGTGNGSSPRPSSGGVDSPHRPPSRLFDATAAVRRFPGEQIWTADRSARPSRCSPGAPHPRADARCLARGRARSRLCRRSDRCGRAPRERNVASAFL